MHVLIGAIVGRDQDHFETCTCCEYEKQFEPVGGVVVLIDFGVHYNLLDILVRSYGHRADLSGHQNHQHRHGVKACDM